MAVNTDSIVSNLYSTYSSQSKTGKTNKENATGKCSILCKWKQNGRFD